MVLAIWTGELFCWFVCPNHDRAIDMRLPWCHPSMLPAAIYRSPTALCTVLVHSHHPIWSYEYTHYWRTKCPFSVPASGWGSNL